MDVAERSGSVEFSCAICGKIFSLRVQLLQHTKRNHGLHREDLRDFAELQKRPANITKDHLIDGLTTPPSELDSSTRTPYCLRPADLDGLQKCSERKRIDPKREYVTTRGHFTCCLCPRKFTLLPDWFIHYEQSHLLESPCAATQKPTSIDRTPIAATANPQEDEKTPSIISTKHPDAGHVTRMRCFLGTLRKELLETMKTVESSKMNGRTETNNSTNLKSTSEETWQHDKPQIASVKEHATMTTNNLLLRCPQCPVTFRIRAALLKHIARVHSVKEKTKEIKKVKRSNPQKVDECTFQEVKGQWTVRKPTVKRLSHMRNEHRNHDNIPIEPIMSEDKKGDKLPSRHLANTSRIISQSVNYLKEDMEDSWASVKTDKSFSHTDNNISDPRHSFTCHVTPPNETQPLCHWQRDHSYQLPHRCNTEIKMDMISNNPTRTNSEHKLEAASTWETVRLEAQKQRKESKRAISTTSRTFYPKRCKYCPKWLFSSETFASHLQIHVNVLSSCPHCPLKCQSKVSLQRHIKTNHENNPSEFAIPRDNDVKSLVGEAPCTNSPDNTTCVVKTNSKRRQRQSPRLRERSLCPENLERIGDVHQKIHQKRTPSQCSSCSEEFHHEGRLNADLKHVHAEIPLKTKRKQLNVERHVDELVEAEFECEKCGKLVPTRQALINHRRVHKASDETTFCRYCSRSFRYRKNFRCHMLIMHDEMPLDVHKNDILSPGEERPKTMNGEKARKTEKWKEMKPSEDDDRDGTTSSEADECHRDNLSNTDECHRDNLSNADECHRDNLSNADECHRDYSSNADECDGEKPEKCNTRKPWKPGKSRKKKPCKTEKWDTKKSLKVLTLPAKLRSSKEDDIKVSMKCISKRKSSASASKFEQLVSKCENPYVCLMCDLPFRRFEALKMHIKNLHQLGEDQANGLAAVIQFQHDLVVESELAKTESTIDDEFC